MKRSANEKTRLDWVASRRRKNRALLVLLLLFTGVLYVLSIVKYL